MDIKTTLKVKVIAWWIKGLLEPAENKRKDLTGIYLGKKLKEVIEMGEETPETKKWYSSKTMWINALTTIAGILTALNSDKGISPQTVGYLATGLGIVNMVLRMITDKPIDKGEQK